MFEGLDVRCYDPALFAAVKCLAFYCSALIFRHLPAKGCRVALFFLSPWPGLKFPQLHFACEVVVFFVLW